MARASITRRRGHNRKRRNSWKAGKWIKAAAVRIRREAGRLVMDIKR